MTAPTIAQAAGGRRHPSLGLAAIVVLPISLAACSGGSGGQLSGAQVGRNTIVVNASDTTCQTSTTSVDAGNTTLKVTNKGSKVTEVYVYAGQRVVTERENIGPGFAVEVVTQLPAGSYQIACKPGMKGDGIRQPLTVKAVASTAAPAQAATVAQAVQHYRTYVQTQVDNSLPLVEQFTDAVIAGDVTKAKQLFAPSRVGWESIEPVAESFGDLDPEMDARENDVEAGQPWTGWHRIEKQLWTQNNVVGMAPIATKLLADFRDLQQRVATAPLDATTIANGAKELLDEVATGKVTGEEDRYSHTDLVDFAANIQGAQEAYAVLKPIVKKNDPSLIPRLDTKFAAVNKALAVHGSGTTFAPYNTLSQVQVKTLAQQVDAVAEPLSHLAAAATTS